MFLWLHLLTLSVLGSCFELFSASTAFYITLAIFAPSTRKDLVDVYRTRGISAVQKKLTQITTSTAEASQPADERAIKEIINQLPKGFTTLDSIMHDKLSSLVMETLANEEGMTDEQALHQELQSSHEEIGALAAKIAELEAKNAAFEAKNAALEAKNAALEAKVAELEAKVALRNEENAEANDKSACCQIS